MRFLISVCFFLFFVLPTWADGLKIGTGSVVINPPEGTPLAGYYEPRGMKTILDDIQSKALVLEKDGTKVALIVCDLISLPRHTVQESRREIEKRTGIPAKNIMISATHTHTGPVVARESARDDLDGGSSDLGRRYTDSLPDLIAKSVEKANKNLQPTRISGAKAKEEHLAFNRRFLMKDNSISWNPRKKDPNIVRPAGPIDPEVSVLFFDSPQNKPLATYVNFAMHPDTVGGEVISADYPGILSRLLSEYKGPEMLTLFANGCCGNLNHRNIQWDHPQKGITEAKRLGTILAGAVFRAYPDLQPLAEGEWKIQQEMVALPLAPITEEDIQKAQDVVANIKNKKVTFMEKVKAFQVLDIQARKGKPLEVEVQVITLGDQVAWISLPGEIFVELGLAIKKDSPFPYTLIAELANGSIGYIPNASAYPEGNYEVVSARCAKGSGEMLVEAALRMLHQAKKKK